MAPMAKDKGNRTKGSLPEKDMHRLTTLEQMKVLADPRRIRILELLCEERTTKQVAELLGEPPTRLYHHVSALARVGLIRLARTRQCRGAVEKYFVAVAKTFSADPRLFTSRRASQARAATQDIATQFLELTANDLRALLEEGGSPEALQKEGILSCLEVRGSPRELKAIHAKVAKLIENCVADKGKPTRAEGAYRLTIAYFPLARRTGSR
jgi:DNA-binding transcriptional ArsR family regulator